MNTESLNRRASIRASLPGVLLVVASLALPVSVMAQSDATESSEESSKQSDSEAKTDEEQSENQGRAVTLEPLIKKAATNGDLVDEFKARREAAEWKKYQAKWAPAPKIESTTTLAPVPANADPDDLRANYGEISEFQIGPLINESINVYMPVYTFGRIKIARQLADIGIDVAELKNEAAREDVLFQTKRAYYGLQLSRTFAPILEKGNRLIEEKLQEMENARDFGDKDFSIDDYRRLQIFATEVESRMADNQKLREVSTSGLQFLTEIEAEKLTTSPLDADSDPKKLAPLDVYWRYARSHRTDLRKLRKAVRARQLQTKMERRNFYPNIALFTGLSYSWSTENTASQPVFCRADNPANCPPNVDNLFAEPDTDPLDRFSVRLGVAINWNVDILNQHGQLNAVDAKTRKLKAQKRRATRAVRLDIEKKYSDASDALEKIRIERRRLDAAESWRDQVGFKMEAAGIDFGEDDIKPIREFYEAKAAYLRARTEYRVARAALAQAIGTRWLENVTADNKTGDTDTNAEEAPEEAEKNGDGSDDKPDSVTAPPGEQKTE